jgi:hypothetical protein
MANRKIQEGASRLSSKPQGRCQLGGKNPPWVSTRKGGKPQEKSKTPRSKSPEGFITFILCGLKGLIGSIR